MITILTLHLSIIFITTALGVIEPPSPGSIPELINNPFLEPENFEQFTNLDFSDLQSEDLSSSKSGETRKPRKRRKYTNEQEAKEAKLLRNREYGRNWRTMVKALPDGSELKEAMKRRNKEYDKKKYRKIKSLPDGHKRKEAKRLSQVKYSRERIKMLKTLPDDDPKKQKHHLSQRQAQKNYYSKKKEKDPTYFNRKLQKHIQKMIAQQRNS